MKGILREDVVEGLSTIFFWVLAFLLTGFFLVGSGVALKLMWIAFKFGWNAV